MTSTYVITGHVLPQLNFVILEGRDSKLAEFGNLVKV